MDEQHFQPVKLADYRPPEFLIKHVDLDFSLADEQTIVSTRLVIKRNQSLASTHNDLVLQGEQLELLSIALDGVALDTQRFIISAHDITVFGVPDRFELSLTNRIHPEKNTALSGLYRSSGMFCTQCEAEGFRRITYFLDRPDVLATYTTRIEASRNSCPVLLSNGNLVETGSLDQDHHFAVWNDPYPKPSYLFALVAGDLVKVEDQFFTASGKDVALEIYVTEKNQNKCGHAMASLKKAMHWDERVYGREYDLERYMIVAVDDFNMGAMENKGLNIFNAKYVLASPETATDQDYIGIESVIAHEYFHNWTGNRITCRDWFQLSLKEGLTVFRDQQFSADMQSAAVQRIEDVRLLRQVQFREDGGPMAHPVRPDQYLEINNFYTVTVYNKGAEVIRMMYRLLGPERFRKGMDLYFQRHDGQAVTCDDFVAAMADASGTDLTQFKHWYSQAGTPRLSVTCQWNQENSTYSVTIRQMTPPTPGQPEKLPLHMPVAIGLIGIDGHDLTDTVESTCRREGDSIMLELNREEQTFEFQKVTQKPVISFLRSFSAPVNVKPFQTRDEQAFLMKYDTDLFNRWDAAFALSESIILEVIESIGKTGNPGEIDGRYLDALQSMIAEPAEDRALTALALQLPTENHLAQRMDIIDPELIFEARRHVRRWIAEQLSEPFQALYESCAVFDAYTPTAEQIGFRNLRNVCLDYLCAGTSRNTVALELCARHYDDASNMTDQFGALSAIVHHPDGLRDELFSDFEKRWSDEPLVMDKWFAIQAGSAADDTYERVLKLISHAKFSLNNPNKVRSLIGAFGQNHYHFHEKSGGGYRFLADMIVKIDPLNPQLAARLTNPLIAWKRYDDVRQQLIVRELERIARLPGLSRDVYEIVRKSLDA